MQGGDGGPDDGVVSGGKVVQGGGLTMNFSVQGADGGIDDGGMSGGRGDGGAVRDVHNVDVFAVAGHGGDGGFTDMALRCTAPTGDPSR